jgi:AcrR family transcriptional regulator
METKKTAAPRGRPRAFRAEEALDRALEVFWRKGYDGTTLTDLTQAMGINRPSLYAAFGDKAALFRKVLDRYSMGPAGYVRKALQEPTARAVVERLLFEAAEQLTASGYPPGCLAVQAALSCGEGSESIRRELCARRAGAEAALRERLERARLENDLPPEADPADLARYVTTVLYGMSVHAAGGASRDDLQRVVHAALRAWPTAGEEVVNHH